MMSSFLSFFTKGNERSIKAKKNIFFLALIKIASILISFLLVSITINYVDPDRYGIWLTISSLVAWIGIFDIGLSNGMRNKLGEAIANKQYKKAKIYVSTTYTSLCLIFILLIPIFLGINKFINWNALLNITSDNTTEIHTLVSIILIYFCFQFILKIINSILTADQNPAKAAFIDMTGQLLALCSILALTKTTSGSLIYLGLGLTIAPLLTYLVANIILFHGKYKKYKPSLSHFKIKYFQDTIGLSFKFFVIQIAALIQYQTANIIIARNFSLEDVTDYNIAYKYFNTLLMVFIMLLTPFWSAATEAYAKKDFHWITNAVKRYRQILLLFIIGGVIMLLLSPFIYDLWIGKNVVSISFQLSLWAFIYVTTTIYGSIHVYLLNGISAIRIQYLTSIFTPLLFICLCWFFIHNLGWGVYSIFIASIISNCNGIIIAPIQYHKIFIDRKGGLWKA